MKAHLRTWRLVAIAVLSAAGASAQSSQSFEVASVRPLPPAGLIRMEGGPGTTDPGRIDYRASLEYLIMAAYQVGSFQVLGPSWLNDRKFEIVAKLPPGATGPQLREMLKSLLRERFHLALHREQRVMPVSVLTVAKSGPKLKESQYPRREIADGFELPPTGAPNELEVDQQGYPNVPPNEGAWLVTLRSGRSRTHQLNASMHDLAVILSNRVDRPVTDGTGLTGRYDFTLSWQSSVSVDTEAGPDLESALQQQLGLKLETSKTPVEVLVIDGIEKDPTEN